MKCRHSNEIMESQLQHEQHTREIGAWGVSHSVGAAQESLKQPPSLSLFFSLFKQPLSLHNLSHPMVSK